MRRRLGAIGPPAFRIWGLSLGIGALAALGQAPFDALPATLIGFALGFWHLSCARNLRCAARRGWAIGFGYFLVSLHWIVEPFFVDAAAHAWMAPFALPLLAGGLAVFWGGAAALGQRMGGAPWQYAVALALAELARAYILTGFPWAMAAQTVIDWPLYQAAALIGPHGVNLALLAWCAGLVHGLRATRPETMIAVLVAGFVGFFAPMPQDTGADVPGDDAPMIRLVQPNAKQSEKWLPENVALFFDRQVDFTAAAPVPGARAPDLVVWPETAVPYVLEHAAPALAQIADAAQGAPVLLGIQRRGLSGSWYNSAVVVDDAGRPSALYDKHHLVPFGEYFPLTWLAARLGIAGLAANDVSGYAAGPGARLMDVAGIGRVLPLICYEVIFAQDVTAAPARPDVLVQITNDGWFGQFSGPYQHLAQARMRAVEMGLPMVRAANTGVSAVIDARGGIRAQIALGVAGYLDAPLPPARAATLYSRTGDSPVFCVLAVIIGLGLRMRRRIPVDAGAGAA